MRITIAVAGALLVGLTAHGTPPQPVWPPPPDAARVAYVGEIRCDELEIKSGFLGKFKRLLAGASETEQVRLPFDVLAVGGSLYLTCQNTPALVEIDVEDNSYKLHHCDEQPLSYPIALCDGGSAIFLTDSENGIVYRFANGKLKPLITEGLNRPTGITALPQLERLYVINTGDHTVKIFDYEGVLIRSVGGQGEPDDMFNYPTFATGCGDGILVNDALNHQIKRIDSDGKVLSTFGEEGNGPGTFSRPKGIATDSEAHIYVVDNLFDNIQVFDDQGRILLVIGSGGQESGQFWSPGGIDIVNDTIYVADTYNNRIQILEYLGDGR